MDDPKMYLYEEYELSKANKYIDELEEKFRVARKCLEAFAKNPLASNPLGYEFGEEFYQIEIDGEMQGMRQFAKEALELITKEGK